MREMLTQLTGSPTTSTGGAFDGGRSSASSERAANDNSAAPAASGAATSSFFVMARFPQAAPGSGAGRHAEAGAEARRAFAPGLASTLARYLHRSTTLHRQHSGTRALQV